MGTKSFAGHLISSIDLVLIWYRYAQSSPSPTTLINFAGVKKSSSLNEAVCI